MTNIYQTYQDYGDATDPLRVMARGAAQFWQQAWPDSPSPLMFRHLAAVNEVFARTQLTHIRPPFAIEDVFDNGRTVVVQEEIVDRTPFCSLLHFKKNVTMEQQPKVLLVAPMSGHFSTLLRGTVKTLLRDHDVYITDWHNARDIPLTDGRFGLDEYVGHLIRFMQKLERVHLVAVCQPTVAAITAVAVMAQENDPAQPLSMTLMAGPLDTRINPTTVNDLAKSKPIEWFEDNLIGTVPTRYEGSGRRVYPGFMQLAAFMNMNLNRHLDAFRNLYNYLIEGDTVKAEAVKTFYEEYFSMADLPAEFYLETVRVVFQEHALPMGNLQFRGQRIDLKAIRRTALFTVEGEKDDICAVGQTLAAQEMCSSIRPYMRQHHIQTAVGHYGVFNGKKWENEIYPHLRSFIKMHHAE